MMEWQGAHSLCVQGGNVEQLETMTGDGFVHELSIRNVQHIFLQADFDGFPIGGRTDKRFVRWIQDMTLCRRTELRIAEVKPQPSGVEKQFHSIYSLKSARCSSSSLTIVIVPRPAPKTGRPTLRLGFSGERCFASTTTTTRP